MHWNLLYYMKRKLLVYVLLTFIFSVPMWADETTAVKPVAGEGTEGSPYEIASLANLRWLSETSDAWGSCFIQTIDINASETADWNSGDGFSPIGNSTTYFSGEYNGNGFIISGLTINRSSESYVGLFGYTNNGSVQNLGVTECSIKGYDFVGGIAGYCGFSISRCYVSGSINGYEYVGGFAGYNISSISNCYIKGLVSGDNYVGGMVGMNYASVSKSYTTESVSGTTYVGRLVGMNYSTVNDCFFMTQLSDLTSAIGYDNNGQKAAELSSTEMQTFSSFTDWDFAAITTDGSDDIWAISTGTNDGYPVLLWQLDKNEPGLGEFSATLDDTAVDLSCSFNSLGIPNPVSYGFCYSTSETTPVIDNEDCETIDLGVINGSTDALGATDNFTGIISDIKNKPAYYIRAYAKNAAGIVYSNTESMDINDAPEITSEAVTTATEDILYSYQVEAKDPDGDELYYSLIGFPDGMEISRSGLITWTPTEGVLTSGELMLIVNDYDRVDIQMFVITVTPVNDPPEITSSALTKASENVLYSYSVVVKDPDDDTFIYSLSKAPEGMEISSAGVITWTPGEGVTSADVTVVVSDGYLTDTQSYTITVNTSNKTPQITSTAIISATEDVEYIYQVEANDPDGDELSYTLSGAPSGMEISSKGLITWTPREGIITSGQVTVVVSDGEDEDTQVFTIGVTPVNDAPVITSSAITNATEDVVYSYQVVANDAEGDVLSYVLSGAPEGMEISTAGLITWTPGEGVLTSGQITIIVNDGEYEDKQEFTISVTPVNDEPLITSAPITNATEDVLYSYQVKAEDPEGEALIYSLTNAPEGMVISKDGLITWTPGEGVLSSGEVIVLVSDYELVADQEFSVSVLAVNDAPVITSKAITEVDAGDEYTYQIVAEDVESDPLTYSLSNAPAGMEISMTGLITWTPPEGVVSGEVSVVVSDGSLQDIQSYIISVTGANSAPVITSTAITTVYGDEEYSYQVVAEDPDDDELTYTLNSAPEGMEISSAGLVTWTAGEGVTTAEVTIVVSDGSLSDTQSYSIMVSVVNDAPKITSEAITNATEDEEYTYQVEAEDPEGDDLTYSLSNAPDGMEISSAGLVTWTAGEGVTTAAVTIVVSDGSLSDTQSYSITVSAVNDAPEITSEAITVATEDEEYSYQVVAEDPEGEDLTYSLSNAPDGMEISTTGFITWTPSEGVTSEDVTIIVSDGNLQDSQSFIISVSGENSAPEITSTAITTAKENKVYSYQVEAEDPDGDVLSYSLSGGPEGMEITTDGLITWTPKESVTTAEVTVVVSDGNLQDTQSYTISVTEDDALEITSTAITTATEGEEYSYQIEAEDTNSEREVLTYSLSSFPKGMEISSAGLITWIPDEGVESAEVLVVVSDGEFTVYQLFTIVVLAVNNAPEITSTAITSATEDLEYTYQVEAEDPENDVLTYSLINAPDGMEISSEGLITWTPAERVATSGEFVVVVSDGELLDIQSLKIQVGEDYDEFNVYPNPVSTTLYIQGTKSIVDFYNLTGKKVFSFDLAQNYMIDISFLPGGIYLLKVDGHVVRIVKR